MYINEYIYIYIYIWDFPLPHFNYRRLTVARSCRASGTLWQYHMACFFKKRLHCRATLKARPGGLSSFCHYILDSHILCYTSLFLLYVKISTAPLPGLCFQRQTHGTLLVTCPITIISPHFRVWFNTDSCLLVLVHVGVFINEGSPTWMICFMENPPQKIDER